MALKERINTLAKYEAELQKGTTSPKFWSEILYSGQDLKSIADKLEQDVSGLASSLASSGGKDRKAQIDFWDAFSFARDFVARYGSSKKQQLAGLRTKLLYYQYLLHENSYVEGD